MLDLQAQKLSDYDFASEISVNILGHIFEQSLTDLEELQASINDTAFDTKKSKRKKDGVFYTPEYITKYIVDNTLGKLCNDKRLELNIGSDALASPKNLKRLTKAEQTTKTNLEAYKAWLFDLKILDPACGSGAFLNQALEFLIIEHKNLQYDLAKMGDLFASYAVEESVLENNLYGVDINEDAVEIARLSLWIRTAVKGRELTKLADKILCANSLLDMPFDEGSFDVVIGNPPYVRVQGLKSNYADEAKIYEKKYQSAIGNYDLYVLFMEMSYKMLTDNGKLSYMLPYDRLSSDKWQLTNSDITKVLEKINQQPLRVKDIFIRIFSGIQTSGDNIYLLLETKDGLYSKSLDKIVEIEKVLLKPILKGEDISRYKNLSNKYFVVFPYLIKDNKATPMSEEYIKDNFPNGYNYLKANEEFLRSREKGKMDKDGWFLYIYPKSLTAFEQEKIIAPDILKNMHLSYDNSYYAVKNGAYGVILKDDYKKSYKYYLSLLNSSLMWFFLKNKSSELRGGYFRFNTKFIEPFPLPKLPNYKQYQKNINYLINLPQQKRYDRDKKFTITTIDNQELYITEFLFAKQRGYIEKYQGHIDLDLSFYKLLSHIDKNLYTIFENSDDKRLIYGINLDNKRTLLIATENNLILSIFIQNNKNLNKQILNGRLNTKNQLGETTNPLTLNRPAGSCPKAFWRQTDFLELLYQDLTKMSISEDDFIIKTDLMLKLNKTLQEKKQNFINELELEKIPKKLQNFEELDFDDFIKEYKKAKKIKFSDKLQERNFKNEWRALFENDSKIALDLKAQIDSTDREIDKMVYALYRLTEDEVLIVEGE